MTCAQGLLRLLWGGPEVGVLRDCIKIYNNNISRFKFVLLHNITYQSIDHISVYVEFFDVLLNEY